MDNINKQNNSGFYKLLSAIAGRLFKNESKVEAAVFIVAVLLSAVLFVLNIITAVASGIAAEIIRSLTVGVIFFLFVPLLTVSDRFYVVREKSLILIAYSAASIILAVTGFIGTTGVELALAILGLISAIALYGTIIFDQLVMSDHPAKYWLIYGGALYKVLYALVMLIIGGVNAASVTETITEIVNGFAAISVLVMLLYLFDGFSFAKYMIFEIIDAGDDKDEPANQTGVTSAENMISANTPANEDSNTAQKNTDEVVNADISNEAEYVPYAEDETAPAQQVEAAKEKTIKEDSPKPDMDLGKLLGTAETEPEEQAAEAVVEDNSQKAPDASDEIKDETPETVKAQEISPVEFKYVRFAAAHNKPEETLQVTGMSGDLFDVWVDGDTICFLNDLKQAADGRGIRSAVISFGDVSGFRFDKLDDGAECVVLTYMKSDETREIRFSKESFVNFKRVMEQAGE